MSMKDRFGFSTEQVSCRHCFPTTLSATGTNQVAGEQPDPQLAQWLETIPNRLRDQLVRIGLLDAKRAAAGKPLLEHLEDFRLSFEAKDSTAEYVELLMSRLRRAIADCSFVMWTGYAPTM